MRTYRVVSAAIIAALVFCSISFSGSAPTVRVTGIVVTARGVGYPGPFSTERPRSAVPSYVEVFIDRGDGDPISVVCPERLNAWCWNLPSGTKIWADVQIAGTAPKPWNGGYDRLGTVVVLVGVRMWRKR